MKQLEEYQKSGFSHDNFDDEVSNLVEDLIAENKIDPHKAEKEDKYGCLSTHEEILIRYLLKTNNYKNLLFSLITDKSFIDYKTTKK